MYVQPGGYGYGPPRPEKDYLGEAILTLILYYLGFGIVGLIVNIIFLSNANRYQRDGIMVRNKGCLTALLWVHIALGVLACIAAIVVVALGGLGVIFGSSYGY